MYAKPTWLLMKPFIRAAFCTTLLFALANAGNAYGGLMRLMIDSEAGDFVGQGQNLTLEYDDDLGSRLQIFASSGSVRWVLDDAVGASFNTFSTIHFRTDTVGLPLQVGTYLNARRAAFAGAGEPGMDVSFQNRGSNQVFGEFTINGVDFFELGGNTVLGRIDISFEQHSESPANPALRGNVFYQHSAFVSVPEPGSLAAFASIGVFTVIVRKRRRTQANI